jgi:hypothetical protein
VSTAPKPRRTAPSVLSTYLPAVPRLGYVKIMLAVRELYPVFEKAPTEIVLLGQLFNNPSCDKEIYNIIGGTLFMCLQELLTCYKETFSYAPLFSEVTATTIITLDWRSKI